MSSIKHVAIIMDGNGRWANRRLRPRIWGHVRGSAVVSDIVRAADDIGLKALTMYAFSTENWSRPLEEVSTLFRLLKKFLIKEKARILANNIKFKVIGEIQNLPHETISLIKEMEALTAEATGLKLTFAFNYGGRAEILRAVNAFHLNYPGRTMTENDLNDLMYRPETGDVDLMIRTGGEQRISNFLLWQMAYAEMYFTPTRWPDFTPSEFKKIIEHVSCRERRFGNVCGQTALEHSMEKAETNKSVFIKGANL
ncbi:polyprenyl diphosphate synthase [Peredibacter starrii]|uniref:Isoprenyl transferase n=1 Tax=Peredibacter starrii TaxID=28202 RepID=A0AAX4HQZ2_9BACT|nr:polyprenyl diphosphate synthase [Peredibacter starrii]WPU65642.1 polyprenyl diphosphate synthase [Peredibacter starrii]